jgi:small subunit ribosomal protein S20
MPKIKGAKKALRQSKRRAVKNKSVRKAFKEVVKKFRKTVDSGDMKAATQQLALAYKALDKAAKANVIKKNTASRLKSRLAQHLAKKSK